MSATPKSSWGWVKALLHSIYDQADSDAVHAQFDRVVDALADILAFTAFPREVWLNRVRLLGTAVDRSA